MAQKQADIINIEDLLKSGTATEIGIGETRKEKLTSKDPHINFDFTQGQRLPYGLFQLKEKRDSFNVEIISLGNMIGFKKTMMFPLILALDGEGKEIVGESILYETRKPTGNLPMHLAASWKFTAAEKLEYILIYPDMISSKDTTLQTGSNQGIVVNALLKRMRVKKDAYARFHITIR